MEESLYRSERQQGRAFAAYGELIVTRLVKQRTVGFTTYQADRDKADLMASKVQFTLMEIEIECAN